MIIQSTQGVRPRPVAPHSRWRDSIVRITPNGHLHAAIVVALLVCLALALVAPISRTAAGEDARPLRISPGALAEALGMPSGPVTGALISGGSDEPYPQRVMPLLAINLIPEPLLVLTGRVAGDSASGAAIFSGPYRTFSVYQDGLTTSYSSALPTVGEALAEAGVTIGPGDTVYPDPNGALTPGLRVVVRRAIAVTLIVGGEEREVHTLARTVGGLLDEQDVDLQKADRVSKRVSSALRGGMTIRVTTVREATEYVDEPIPFRTVYEYDATLSRGEEVVRQAGETGHLIRGYLVKRVDGVETSSEIISETLTLPVDEIVAIGTYVPPSDQPVFTTGTGEEINCGGGTLHVWATWYTAASSGGSGITRTGTGVYKGIIAVDPAVIALGTYMYVPGYGFGVAADTGGGIRGNMIDLGYGADDVKDWRTGYTDVCIIG